MYLPLVRDFPSFVIPHAIRQPDKPHIHPCKSKLDLEQSLKKADLVIIGKRIDYDPEEKMPSSIKVNIIKVLKGKIKKGRLKLKAGTAGVHMELLLMTGFM